MLNLFPNILRIKNAVFLTLSVTVSCFSQPCPPHDTYVPLRKDFFPAAKADMVSWLGFDPFVEHSQGSPRLQWNRLRRHVWNLFGALTEPSGIGDLPIWAT